jgi:hypothetical protein
MDLEAESSEDEVRRSNSPYFIVLMSGVVTSAMALAGVYWLNHNADNFHIMGWYANFVIPVGAMLVGAAASSGYAIASWLTGTRISRLLLAALLFLQTGAYVLAEYVEYENTMDTLKQQGMLAMQQPSFLEYYDFKARSFAWKAQGPGNQQGQPLGAWGYVFVLLGAAGFIGSGLISPAVLYNVPYCDPCQRYMKTKLVGVLPASVPVKKIAKKDKEGQAAHVREQQQAGAKANEVLDRLRSAIEEGSVDAVRQELVGAGAIRENSKLPVRTNVTLVWCNSCGDGRIKLTQVIGAGEKVQKVELSEHAAPADVVSSIRDQPEKQSKGA